MIICHFYKIKKDLIIIVFFFQYSQLLYFSLWQLDKELLPGRKTKRHSLSSLEDPDNQVCIVLNRMKKK